ncbi:hypothetical protein [Sabulibacter ruber]|uniref:hypothetical protein n=1 Tax=Sabulibacter ruber TaxID=2811901 RepID=UPI001A96FEF0|nr:hypothetical protein [Sabulibacter ruber]
MEVSQARSYTEKGLEVEESLIETFRNVVLEQRNLDVYVSLKSIRSGKCITVDQYHLKGVGEGFCLKSNNRVKNYKLSKSKAFDAYGGFFAVVREAKTFTFNNKEGRYTCSVSLEPNDPEAQIAVCSFIFEGIAARHYKIESLLSIM